MKLNHDCVRDLLLHIEENLELGDFLRCSEIEIVPYSNSDIIYTAYKLIEAGYIDGKTAKFADGERDADIYSITWTGHNFLDNIRDDSVWKSTKEKLVGLKSASLNFVNNVAAQVLASMIIQN